MNKQEEKMIADLAIRLKNTPVVDKDLVADNFIKTEVGSNPDALYQLTQSVLAQQQALHELQRQVQELKQNQNQKRGFLGGLFSGNRPSQPMQQQPYYQNNQGGHYQQGPYGSGGGGFLKSAMTTAAGVAGGMLLFQGVEHLFSGGDAGGNTGAESFSGADNMDSLQGQGDYLNDGFGDGNSFMNDGGSVADTGGSDWGNDTAGGDFGGGDFGGGDFGGGDFGGFGGGDDSFF